MPVPEIDQSATEAEECFEQSDETGVRLEDLRRYPATALTVVILFAGLGFVAYESAQLPVTLWNGVAVLGFLGVVTYLCLDFTDHALCMFTKNHECRACKRETDRWTPGEDHRTWYERTTDRIVDTLRPRAPNLMTDGLPELFWDDETRERNGLQPARSGGDDDE